MPTPLSYHGVRARRRRRELHSRIIPFNARTIGEGDSIFSYVDGRSILQWLNIFLNGALKWSPNGVAATDANAGHELSGLDATVATLITEHDPLDLVLMDGGTNDTNVTSPIGSAIASGEHFVDTLNAAGIQVFYMAIPPRSDANAVDKAADQLRINTAFKGWQRHKQLRVFEVDSVWDTSLSDDGTHQNTVMAYAAARKMADDMWDMIEHGDPRDVLGPNLCTNADFAIETGGTLATGMQGGSVMPSEWTVDNDSGATVTSSVVTRDDGSKAVRLDISGSASAAADIRIFQLVTNDYVIDDSFEFVSDLKISGADGEGAPTGLDGWAQIAGNAVCFTQSQSSTLGGMNFAVDNTVRCAPRPNSGAGASFTAGVYFRFAIGAVAARIEFSMPHVSEFV